MLKIMKNGIFDVFLDVSLATMTIQTDAWVQGL